jgi:acylphosphatase
MKEGELARAHAVFRGRVQGVYFRAHCKERADILGVKGWVANREDGSVECVFEGRKKDIESLIEYCRHGQPYARVSDYEVKWTEFRGEYTQFEIRY